MAVLRRALDAANAGNSRVLGIVGEAGSGKSRMVFEFLETCRNEGRPVLEARATAHGRVAPLQTVLDLMRAFFGIDEDMTVADATSRVRAAMARADASRDTALLLDFLSLPLDAGGSQTGGTIAGADATLTTGWIGDSARTRKEPVDPYSSRTTSLGRTSTTQSPNASSSRALEAAFDGNTKLKRCPSFTATLARDLDGRRWLETKFYAPLIVRSKGF